LQKLDSDNKYMTANLLQAIKSIELFSNDSFRPFERTHRIAAIANKTPSDDIMDYQH